MDPDWGLRLMQVGWPADRPHYFYSIEFSEIDLISPGHYSAVLTKIHDGVPHAVSFDFDDDILTALLSALPNEQATAFSRTLRGYKPPCFLQLPATIAPNVVEARFGELQRGAGDVFVPFIVTKVDCTVHPSRVQGATKQDAIPTPAAVVEASSTRPAQARNDAKQIEPEKPNPVAGRVERHRRTPAFISAVFVVYLTGVVLYAPYFNYQYAQRHGFLSWLFLGEVAATSQSLIWPYFAFIGSSNNTRWTDAERENLEHYHRSKEAAQQRARIVNSQKPTHDLLGMPIAGTTEFTSQEAEALRSLVDVALREAQMVDLEILRKVHPELPSYFQHKYIKCLQIEHQRFHSRVSFNDQLTGQRLQDEWVNWFNQNKLNIRFPKRLSE